MIRRFRIPREEDHQQTTAFEYVRRAWPEGTTDQIRRLFDAGEVQADGIVVTRPDNPLAPQTVVEIDADVEGKELFGVPDASDLLWGDEWVIVDKPLGFPGRIRSDDPTDPVRFLADVLGMDREGVTPVWTMPTNVGGPWVLARRPEVAAQINEAIVTGGAQTNWVAITPRPPRPQGIWSNDEVTVRFATSRTDGGFAELQLSPEFKDVEPPRTGLVDDILDVAAEAGFPVVGDAERGGYLVAGGMRLRLQALYGSDEFGHSWAAPRQWWPEEPAVPAPEPEPAPQEEVGEPTGVAQLVLLPTGVDRLEAGHPWVLRNSINGSIDRYAAGQPVELLDDDGPTGRFAIIDGTGPVAARLWSDDRADAEQFDDEIAIRVDEAIGRRSALFRQMGSTDLFRVVHGEADGLPGLFVDRVGRCWCVTTTARCARALREPVYRALHRVDAATPIVELEHIETLPTPDATGPKMRVVQPGRSKGELDTFLARDSGLRFRVELDGGIRVDVTPTWRDVRARAVELAEEGTHWIDARCHTGEFCATLVRAGAEVTNVDPRGRYFSMLDTTFELNGLDDALRRDVEADVFEFLADSDEPVDGILTDLSVLRDATAADASPLQLLRLCIRRLHTGGRLFVARPPYEDINLRELIESAATDEGCTVDEIEAVGPPEDFPTMDDFPEGDPFRGVWVRRT